MKIKLTFLFVLVALLAGCDSHPSDANLSAALKKQGGTRAVKIGVAKAGQRVSAAPRVIGCAKAELRSYLCDVSGVGSGLQKVRMVKYANEDWSLVP